MATANISSTFDIVIEGTDLNVAKTFTTPRAFKLVGISVTNIAAGAGTLTITGSTAGVATATTAAPPLAGAGIVQAQSVSGPAGQVSVLRANSEFVTGETISVLASAATITSVTMHCVATGGGQAVTIA